MRCALVSTSGELLAKQQGPAIDAIPLVMRLGQAPVEGEFAPHVGTRTSVRYLAGSFFQAFRHMNHTALHATLNTMRAERSEVVWTVLPREFAPWHEAVGCPHPITAFMQQHPGLPYRCTTTAAQEAERCGWPGIRQPSSGVVGISLLFGVFGCKSVALFGFANDNTSLPYHYWRDGSHHDNATTAMWYSNRIKSRTHHFDREHRLMHDVVGGCSWELTRERYQEVCRTRFAAAPAASCSSSTPQPSSSEAPAADGEEAASPPRLLASTSPFLVLRQYWSRARAAAARAQVLEAMTICHDIGEGGDNRTMGISAVTQTDVPRFRLIHEFLEDTRLHTMAAAHLGMAPRDLRVTTLAGSTAPGQSSGGGWHKDALSRGVKALIYLDDVLEPGVGPFAMLLNYSDATLKHSVDPRRRRTRFAESAVQRQVLQGARVNEILGDAGTVIVFETSSVHRGMAATTGGRVALTNYYQNDLATCGAKRKAGAKGRSERPSAASREVG